MDYDEIKNRAARLALLKLNAETAQNTIGTFKHSAGSALTDLALTHFSELNDMEADDIRKFGSLITEYTRNLAEDLNKLNFKIKQSKG